MEATIAPKLSLKPLKEVQTTSSLHGKAQAWNNFLTGEAHASLQRKYLRSMPAKAAQELYVAERKVLEAKGHFAKFQQDTLESYASVGYYWNRQGREESLYLRPLGPLAFALEETFFGRSRLKTSAVWNTYSITEAASQKEAHDLFTFFIELLPLQSLTRTLDVLTALENFSAYSNLYEA